MRRECVCLCKSLAVLFTKRNHSGCISRDRYDLQNTSIYQHVSASLSLSLSLVLYFGYIHVYTQCRNHVDERMFNIGFFSGVCTSFKSLLLLYVSVFRYLNQCTDVNL